MDAAGLKITTNCLPGSRIAVALEIPAERCKVSYEEALIRLSRSIKLPGFRQGKVPRAVILQQIGGERIKATALEGLLEAVWREALSSESIEPLCEPELNGGFEKVFKNFNPAEILKVTLETDINPTPKLRTTKGLNVTAEVVIYDPAKIDELIEQSRKQLATLIPIEARAAAKGDVAVISFKGTYKDGSEIDGGSTDSMDVELEEGQMIPGFIEAILGMKINDEKSFECEFPDNYKDEKSRGKKANFTVNLKELKTRELPKLDDNFAQQASDKKTMVELRADLEKRLKGDASRRNINNRKEALFKGLIEQLEVDLPKTLIDQEVRSLVEKTAQQFAQQGMDVKSMFTPELVKSLMDSSKGEAETSLRQKFALQALAEVEKINVEEKEIEIKFKEIKEELAGEKNIDHKKLHEAIIDDLLEEKLFTWLDQNNEVLEKTPEASIANKKSDSTTKKSKSKKPSTKKPKI